MTTNGNKFDTLKGEPAASFALAAGASYRNAATAVGVSARTIARRMADPDYTQHVRQLRSDMITAASGQLASLTMKAAIRLGELLNSDNDQVVLGASRAILDQAHHYRELVEIGERLERLEAIVDDNAGNVTPLRRRQ